MATPANVPSQRRQQILYPHRDLSTVRCKGVVYAQHGRGLMGCKSPVGELAIQMLERFGAK
jgi:hypothetical protein